MVLSLAFVPWLSGAATTPRWALLAVYVPVVLFFVGLQQLTKCHYLGIAFLAWCALSLAWTSAPFEGGDLFFKLLLLAGAFVIGANVPDMRPAYLGFGIGFALNGALSVAQYFGFDGVVQLIPPAGLFLNKNYLAEPAALLLIGLLGSRMWALAAFVMPAVILPGARGAILAVAVAAVAWIWTRSRAAAVEMAVLILAGLILVAVFGPQASLEQRFAFWRDTASHLTVFGHGLGSFYIDFPSFAVHSDTMIERPTHAHNDFLELAYEFGIGALLFMAFIGYCLRGQQTTETLVLIAFVVEANFGFPLHFPIPAFIAALAAGHICGARSAVRDGLPQGRNCLRKGVAERSAD